MALDSVLCAMSVPSRRSPRFSERNAFPMIWAGKDQNQVVPTEDKWARSRHVSKYHVNLADYPRITPSGSGWRGFLPCQRSKSSLLVSHCLSNTPSCLECVQFRFNEWGIVYSYRLRQRAVRLGQDLTLFVRSTGMSCAVCVLQPDHQHYRLHYRKLAL
jgi:hypothetical protein